MRFKLGMTRVALFLGVIGAIVGLFGTFLFWDDLRQSSPPALAWQYVLTLTIPVVGFVIPWGFVRAVSWVISGFIEAKEERTGGGA
jgi:hypothetical protein